MDGIYYGYWLKTVRQNNQAIIIHQTKSNNCQETISPKLIVSSDHSSRIENRDQVITFVEEKITNKLDLDNVFKYDDIRHT